jgi:hypothetical protein
VLEVASLPQIATALRADDYHVLHLSAHGSAAAVELEDEDGHPARVTTGELIGVLRDAGKPVPLIVLSSCSGGAGGAEAMAVGLVRAGADRVIAMQAQVSDDYATALTAAVYAELAREPAQPVAQALARARRAAQSRPGEPRRARLPEHGLATLVAASGDEPLVDPAAMPARLASPVVAPSGTAVRELSLGQLIGRRRQLREGMAILRRDRAAREKHGSIAGVQLVGVGGIGKTAIAGRLIARLRAEGWLIAVHEGRWNPTALFAVVAAAIGGRPQLSDLAATLVSEATDDLVKADVVGRLLAGERLLVVFDDFEQNLTPGGDAFADPGLDDLLTGWCLVADTGTVLVTCRHRLPGADRFLPCLDIPRLSPAELRRLLLRMPALRGLPTEDRRVLARVIGGHPRLIEYADALVRGKPTGLKAVQARLRDLARRVGVDLDRPRPLGQAVEETLLLGSADILLSELLGLLTDRQRAVLDQLSVSRAPMRLDDLAHALAEPDDATGPQFLRALGEDVGRLAELTLLNPGQGILVHPWIAEHLARQDPEPRPERHERALAMRLRRFKDNVPDGDDRLEAARHLAALRRWDEVADLAEVAGQILPGTLAVGAFLAEVRPLIPVEERAWLLVGDLEAQALLAAGDIPAAARLLDGLRQQTERRAAADPANTAWQRDLSISRDKLGNVAVAGGDLADASEHYRASLAIAERLAAADPANTAWQRDLFALRDQIRRHRRGDSEAWDARWIEQTGQPPPAWMLLDAERLQSVMAWIETPTYGEEEQYLAAHPELHGPDVEPVVDEALLLVPRKERERLRGVLRAAREAGVEAAYASFRQPRPPASPCAKAPADQRSLWTTSSGLSPSEPSSRLTTSVARPWMRMMALAMGRTTSSVMCDQSGTVRTRSAMWSVMGRSRSRGRWA